MDAATALLTRPALGEQPSERPGRAELEEATVASTWLETSGSEIADELLEWPPDVFALTDVIIERAGAFRFALPSPKRDLWPPRRFEASDRREWPPNRFGRWSNAVERVAREWSAWVEDHDRPWPHLLTEEWAIVLDATATPLERLAEGQDWRTCEALLTLHTIADEACAGLFVALDRSEGQGCLYRARARELLARTGSLARIRSRSVRVLPKVSTPANGRESFSRYACVHQPGTDVRWHKVPARHPGTDARAEHVNMLLLPWPLRVREADFRPVKGSLQRLPKEPFGLFEFAPSEGLDLDLVDRVLVAARDEVGHIDVVALPESAIDASEIQELEALLDHHGVVYVQAGVRERARRSDQLGRNWVHIGVNPGLEKGQAPEHGVSCQWFHIRQNKHHRWSLDESQIYQYHLGGALHPHVRWWEAMDVPRRSLQLLQVGEEITIASLVCEDLAQNDDVAAIIRSVGPTVVSASLLDGPQLASRWAARYAGVLADDPGCAVLTLTSYGMVRRSRPPGHDPSSVVALWKDPERGTREISLDPGAHGIVLTLCGARATRRSADGRWPVDTGTRYFDAALYQIEAAARGSGTVRRHAANQIGRALEVGEVTVLTGWVEGLAEALAHAPGEALAVLGEALGGSPWRAELGIPDPPRRVSEAISSISQLVMAATPPDGAPTLDAVLAAAREDPAGEPAVDRIARRVLRSVLEQLRTRQAQDAGR